MSNDAKMVETRRFSKKYARRYAWIKIGLLGAMAIATILITMMEFDDVLANLVRSLDSAGLLVGGKALASFRTPLLCFSIVALANQYAVNDLTDRVNANRLILIGLSVGLAACSAELVRVLFKQYHFVDQLLAARSPVHLGSDGTQVSFPSTFCASLGAAGGVYLLIFPIYRPTSLLLIVLGITAELVDGVSLFSDCLMGLFLGATVLSCLLKIFEMKRLQVLHMAQPSISNE